MKTLRLVSSLAMALAVAAAVQAANSSPKDPNPTKDPKIQDGYDRHQKAHKEKRQKEEKPKQDTSNNYEVNKSKDTARGTSSPKR